MTGVHVERGALLVRWRGVVLRTASDERDEAGHDCRELSELVATYVTHRGARSPTSVLKSSPKREWRRI